MSQEGANLPQEVEGSHDQATAAHGSIPAGIVSSTVTVIPAGSNSRSESNLATNAVNNAAGSSEHASPAMLSTGEDTNATASSKIASPVVLSAATDDNNSASSKIAAPAVLPAGKENKAASPAVLFAGEEEKGRGAGPKLATSAKLHEGDNSKAARSHASMDDNSATRSKLVSSAVPHASDGGNDGGSKQIASPAMPHTTVDSTASSKIASLVAAVLHYGERNNAGFKARNPAAVLHGSKGMANNAERPKFASVVLALPAGEATKARTKLTVQAVAPHAGRNAAGSSTRLTRSAAALLAAKENASKLAILVAPRPHAGKDNNAAGSSSKAAARPAAAADVGDSSAAKEGKMKNVAEKQRRAHEAYMGGGRGIGHATAAEDDAADHDLHIFSERERRKKMKNMFSTLHSLLPHLPDKADKATVVGEAVTFIQSLERTADRLEKLKLERNRQQALAAAQQQQQQQLLMVGSAGDSGSSSRASSSARQPAPPAPAPASREATLADMVHAWELQAEQQAAMAAAIKALAAAAGAGGSSSSGAAAAQPLPRGNVLLPAPAAGFQTWYGQNVAVSVAGSEAYVNLHVPRQLGTLTKVLFVLKRHHLEVVTATVSTQDDVRMYGIHVRANPAPATAVFPENLCPEDRFKLAVAEVVQLINN